MAKEQISIRLPSQILEKISKIAIAEFRSRNNMIEVLIMEAIEARVKTDKEKKK